MCDIASRSEVRLLTTLLLSYFVCIAAITSVNYGTDHDSASTVATTNVSKPFVDNITFNGSSADIRTSDDEEFIFVGSSTDAEQTAFDGSLENVTTSHGINIALNGSVENDTTSGDEKIAYGGSNTTITTSEDDEFTSDGISTDVTASDYYEEIGFERNEIISDDEKIAYGRLTEIANGMCGVRCIIMVPVNRIVGGDEARPHSWPWQCRLEGDKGGGATLLCGASVVSDRFIVTAAHCVFLQDEYFTRLSPDKFFVYCGGHNQYMKEVTKQRVAVSKITVHGNYEPAYPGMGYDIAIFELSEPLVFDGFVQPVCLPTEELPAGTACTVTGWGTTKFQSRPSPVLREVIVPIVDWGICSIDYPGLSKHMICAGEQMTGGKDSCSGDSGGPLVCNIDNRWELHGVVSFGQGCAEPGFPGVYTRVLSFRTWIQNHTVGTLVNGAFRQDDPAKLCVYGTYEPSQRGASTTVTASRSTHLFGVICLYPLMRRCFSVWQFVCLSRRT